MSLCLLATINNCNTPSVCQQTNALAPFCLAIFQYTLYLYSLNLSVLLWSILRWKIENKTCFISKHVWDRPTLSMVCSHSWQIIVSPIMFEIEEPAPKQKILSHQDHLHSCYNSSLSFENKSYLLQLTPQNQNHHRYTQTNQRENIDSHLPSPLWCGKVRQTLFLLSTPETWIKTIFIKLATFSREEGTDVYQSTNIPVGSSGYLPLPVNCTQLRV